jgi:hypothetical protein
MKRVSLLLPLLGLAGAGVSVACSAPAPASVRENNQTSGRTKDKGDEDEDKAKGKAPATGTATANSAGRQPTASGPTFDGGGLPATGLDGCIQQCLASDPAARQLATRLIGTCGSACACDTSTPSCRSICFQCEDQVCIGQEAVCESVFRCDMICNEG